jgi:hypothetical protein
MLAQLEIGAHSRWLNSSIKIGIHKKRLYKGEGMMQNKIYVTKPYLPPLENFMPYLEDIWKSRNLTKNGHYHERFEEELSSFLGVPYVSLFTNGTLALIRLLDVLILKEMLLQLPSAL